MYDHIYVVGNGKTSRANVEALIDDYIYANPKVKFYLYSIAGLSEAQVWLKQYLEDQKVEFEVFIRGEGVPETDQGTSAYFILWSDEDPESNNLLAAAKENGFPAFDLTNGLAALTAVEDIQVIKSPEIPKQEQVIEPSHPSVDNFVDNEAIEDDEDFEESDEEDPLYTAIYHLAKIFAEVVVKELKKEGLK